VTRLPLSDSMSRSLGTAVISFDLPRRPPTGRGPGAGRQPRR
jgi:hypothetical protein